jgi:YD repeat-containing protein
MALASYKGKQVQVYFQDFTTGGAQTFDIDTVSLAAGTDKTTYTYNALNQPTVQALLNGPTTNMTWDNVGNLLTKTVSSQTTSYSYTADNQVATVTNPANGTTTYTYDVDGNKTQQAYPNGVTEAMSYNTAGQLTQIAATNSANTTLTSFTYSYTNPSTGKLTDLPYSVTDVAGKTTTYTYDATSEMTQAVQKNSSGGTLATYSYAYDPVGNATSQNLNGASTSFTYNAADEVTQAAGAINKTYNWDANGNQTSDSAGTSFSYNSANQNTSYTPAGGTQVQMGYTGPGEAQRVTDGSRSFQHDVAGESAITTSAGTTTITWGPDGGLLSEQVSSGGSMLMRRARRSSLHARTITSSSTYYYLTDGNGSVVGLTDASGSLVNQYSYDPQGNTTSQSGTAPNAYGFGGMGFYTSGHNYYTGDGGNYDPTVDGFAQMYQDWAANFIDPGNGAEIENPQAQWEFWTGILLQTLATQDIYGCETALFVLHRHRGPGHRNVRLIAEAGVMCNTVVAVQLQIWLQGSEGSDLMGPPCGAGLPSYEVLWCPAPEGTWYVGPRCKPGTYRVSAYTYYDPLLPNLKPRGYWDTEVEKCF